MSAVNETGNAAIDGILWGYKWDQSTLTYSFPTSASEYGYNDINGFQAFTTAQKLAAIGALESVETFANMTFDLVSSEDADIRFAEADSYKRETGDKLDIVKTGEATPPDPDNYPTFAHGDMWFNHADFEDPDPGTYAHHTMLHEVGHTLGLKHGHEDQDAHGDVFPALPSYLNSFEFSVMTYHSYIGDDGDSDVAAHHPTTFMQLDIAALQHLYGANFNYRSGNTTYKWDPNSGEMSVNGAGQGEPFDNFILMTVWDGGGKDTYDFSSYSGDLKVDLSPGAFTTTAPGQLADLGDGHVARGNIANARLYEGDLRSLIEDAIGGSGDDEMMGNQTTNVLYGRNGDDQLYGRGGLDVLDGGQGNDTYFLTDAHKFFSTIAYDAVREYGGGGIDEIKVSRTSVDGQAVTSYTLGTHVENGTVIGSQAFNLNGNDAGNVLKGNAAVNELKGLTGNDTLDGGASLDILRGGFGDDYYKLADVNPFYSSSVYDLVLESAGQGIDTVEVQRAVAGGKVIASHTLDANIEKGIVGGNGNFDLKGNYLGNTLTGNAATNKLYGEEGSDTLTGGGGSDALYGGRGDDYYVLSDGFLSGTVVNVDNVFEQQNQGVDTVEVCSIFVSGYTRNSHILGSNIENGIIAGGADFDLTGNELANVLTGNDRDNVLKGAGGSDTLIGGLGTDTANYAFETASMEVALSATAAAGVTIGDVLSDSVIGIENVVGGSGADILRGGGGANALDGGAGADELSGGNGADSLRGGDDNDVIAGNKGNDELAGGSGNDQLLGQNGNDGLVGGIGNDTISGGNGNDRLYGNGGADRLEGGEGADDLRGGVGADSFVFTKAAWGGDEIFDFQDGIDRLAFAKSIADAFADFTVTGNGTNAVTLAIGAQTLELHGNSAITLSGADFNFLA